MAALKSKQKTARENIKKAVLSYSGGLDTSVILLWLQEVYGCKVVAFTADIGQGEEVEDARKKAAQFGAAKIFVEDLREEFVRDFVWPMFRANALYEGEYLLGTAIARPLIAKRQVEIARQTGADALAHGATGKGNDQVRFELSAYALAPDMHIIAPWREWDLTSRQKLLRWARARGVPVAAQRRGASPYSMDANLLHISYEGGELEDPARAPSEKMWRRTISPSAASKRGEFVTLDFSRGDPVALNGKKLSPAKMLARLNTLAGAHGIGRADIVENRGVGMKSRGCYETPGGAALFKMRRALESITLDREVSRLRDDLMPRYAALVYNGLWFSPERRLLQQMFDESQKPVNGRVHAHFCRGNVIVRGRESDDSLFDEATATFEEDAGVYNQQDAEGFIKLNALRLRIAARKGRKF